MKPVKILLMASGAVGGIITEWMIQNYKKDLALVVSDNKYCIKICNKNLVPCIEKREWRPFSSTPTGGGRCLRTPKVTKYDLGILAWWPDILPKEYFSLVEKGFINTHPSYLPYNRGKNPNFWALVEQCPFGVTLHKIDENIDTGPIIAQKRIKYDWTDTGGTIYSRAQVEMVELFTKTYPRIRRFDFRAKPQDDSGSYHHSSEMIRSSQLQLDSVTTPRKLFNLLRARTCDNRPACSFVENGKSYEVTVDIRRVYD